MNDIESTENGANELSVEGTPTTEIFRMYRRALSDDDALDLMFCDGQLYIGEDGKMFGIDPEASRDKAFNGMGYDAQVYAIIGGEPFVNAYFWNEDDDDCKERDVLYFGMDKYNRPNDAQIRGMAHLADVMKGPYAGKVGLYKRGSSMTTTMKDITEVLTEAGMRDAIASAYAMHEDIVSDGAELDIEGSDFGEADESAYNSMAAALASNGTAYIKISKRGECFLRRTSPSWGQLLGSMCLRFHVEGNHGIFPDCAYLDIYAGKDGSIEITDREMLSLECLLDNLPGEGNDVFVTVMSADKVLRAGAQANALYIHIVHAQATHDMLLDICEHARAVADTNGLPFSSPYAGRSMNEDSSSADQELELEGGHFMEDVAALCAERGADYVFSDEGEDMLRASGNLAADGSLHTYDDQGERKMSLYEISGMIPYASFSWTFPKALLTDAFAAEYPEGMGDVRMGSDDFEPDRDISRDFIEHLLSGDMEDQFYYDGGDSEYYHLEDVDDSVKSQLEEHGFQKDIYERIKADPDADEFSDERHQALKDAYQCAAEDALRRGAEDACVADFDRAVDFAVPRGVTAARDYDRGELVFNVTREFVYAYADKIWDIIANDVYYSDEDYPDGDTLADAIPKALIDMFNSYFDFREPYYGWEGFDKETFNDSISWRIDDAMSAFDSSSK